jgi:hypothetical protein
MFKTKEKANKSDRYNRKKNKRRKQQQQQQTIEQDKESQ